LHSTSCFRYFHNMKFNEFNKPNVNVTWDFIPNDIAKMIIISKATIHKFLNFVSKVPCYSLHICRFISAFSKHVSTRFNIKKETTTYPVFSTLTFMTYIDLFLYMRRHLIWVWTFIMYTSPRFLCRLTAFMELL
jgi:hypothetical protein